MTTLFILFPGISSFWWRTWGIQEWTGKKLLHKIYINLSWGINLWRLNEHCLDDEVDRIFLRIFLKPNCFSLVTQVGIRTRWKPFLKVLPHCYKLLHNSGPIRMQAFLSSPEQSYWLYDLIQILSHLWEMMLTILIWS